MLLGGCRGSDGASFLQLELATCWHVIARCLPAIGLVPLGLQAPVITCARPCPAAVLLTCRRCLRPSRRHWGASRLDAINNSTQAFLTVSLVVMVVVVLLLLVCPARVMHWISGTKKPAAGARPLQ